MVGRSLKLTRKQIQDVVGTSPRAVKQFEGLFSDADEGQLTIEELYITAVNAVASANEALGAVSALMDELGAIDAALAAKADKTITITGSNGLNGGGDLSMNRTIELDLAIVRDLTNNTGDLIASSVALTNGAGASLGTLTNAPAVGDPTKWVAIDDAGTTRYIPSW